MLNVDANRKRWGGRFVLFLLVGVFGVVHAADVSRRSPIVLAVEKAGGAVVNIGTEKLIKPEYAELDRKIRGEMIDKMIEGLLETASPAGYRLKHSLGSGVIINKAGYILTNYHVVERATRIHVTLIDDTIHDAILVAGDEVTDLALIKIDAGKPLSAASFTTSEEEPLLGETVIVIGNPYGLSHTVTAGVLSGKTREARYEGKVIFKDILQTDAAVNPGSSGGPLLNIDGKVMGISVAVSEEGQNIGFAVPSRRIRELLNYWCSPRFIQNSWLGLEVEQQDGVLRATHVYSNSPAARMGIEVNDQIKLLNDEPMDSLQEYGEILMYDTNQAPITVGIRRNNEVLVREGVLAAAPKIDPRPLAEKHFGLVLADPLSLTYRASAFYLKGIPITAVLAGSVAEADQIHAGQWLSRINDMDLQTLDDAGFALRNLLAGDEVVLVIVDVDDMGAYAVVRSGVHVLKAE